MLVQLLFSVLASAGSVAVLIATLFVGLRHRRVPKSQVLKNDLRITVMKPLSGLDADLEGNLNSFATLDAHDDFQVLLCLPSTSDAAFGLASQFTQRYPNRFEMAVGQEASFGNSKMAQLHYALPQVKNDFIWISDSNVRTNQASLESLVGAWKDTNQNKKQVTLIHAPLVSHGGSGFGAALERVHLPSLQNPGHELARFIGMHAVVGKSLFFTKGDLAQVGGFSAFGNYLGEDHMMGVAFAALGTVRCAHRATQNTLGQISLRTWWNRHARWSVLRKTMVPGAFFVGEPVISLWMPALLCAFHLISPMLLLTLVFARMVIDFSNTTIVSGDATQFRDLFLGPLKELLLFMIWIQALFTLHVKWREGKSIRIGANSVVLSKTEQTSKWRRHAASLKRVFSGML